MPRIPGPYDARPTPRVSRTLATVRNRGGVAEAAGQLGANVAQLAQQGIEREDKLELATAKGKLIQELAAAQNELQDDPDYATFDKRFQERAKKAREAAAASIQSRAGRALFEADAGGLITATLGEVQRVAHGKKITALTAAADQFEADNLDLAANSLDPAIREATLTNYGSYVDGLVQQGILDPVEAGKRKRSFAQEAEAQGILALADRDQIVEARTRFERARGRLDAVQESRIDGLLLAKEQGREALTLADDYWTKGAIAPTAPGKGTAVPSEPDKPRVLKPGESARVYKWTSVATDVASTFGLNPIDVAAVMSYETAGTFSPTIKGGKGGNYLGLIQFGREERAKYGINEKSSPEQWATAIKRFLHDRGFKKGMGVLDLYSTINAGTPGRYNASDGNGTVRGHVDRLLAEHRGNAKRWLKSGGVEVSEAEYTSTAELPDLGSIYDRIRADAKEQGWTPEKTERVMAAVGRRAERERSVLNQRESENYDRALARALEMGEDFTDLSQLGDLGSVDPTNLRTLIGIADSNKRAAMAERIGDAKDRITDAQRRTAFALDMMEQTKPQVFATEDLSRYFPGLSPEQRVEYTKRQQKVAASLEGWTPYSGIDAAVSRATKFGGVKLDDEAQLAVRQIMQGEAERLFKAGKEPTAKDYDALFISATRNVPTKDGWFSSPDPRPRYELKPGDKARAEITAEFKKRNKREPSEDELMSIYRRVYTQGR